MIEDLEDDPFYDGKSHLPSGQDYEYDPKPIKKGRTGKRKPLEIKAIFNKKTRDYWESLGYRVDRLESWQNVNGAWVQKDFVGCFDLLATKPGELPVMIQISAKSDARNHIRKMSGDTLHDGKETRRSALFYYLESLGWRCVIHAWEQPGGYRNAWKGEVIELTPELIAEVDSKRRHKTEALLIVKCGMREGIL